MGGGEHPPARPPQHRTPMSAVNMAVLLLATTCCLALLGFGLGATLANLANQSVTGENGQNSASVASGEQLGVGLTSHHSPPATASTTRAGATTTTPSSRTTPTAEDPVEVVPVPIDRARAIPVAPSWPVDPYPVPRAPIVNAPPPPPPPAPAPAPAPPAANAIPYSPIPARPFEVDGNTIRFK